MYEKKTQDKMKEYKKNKTTRPRVYLPNILYCRRGTTFLFKRTPNSTFIAKCAVHWGHAYSIASEQSHTVT